MRPPWLQSARRATRNAAGDVPSPAAAGDSTPPAVPVLPLAIVLFSLLSLAAVPILVERQVARLAREVLQVADPAREQVRGIQASLAMEMAGNRAYLLTGDVAYSQRHRGRVQRQAALAELERLAQRSGPEVLSLTQQLQGQLLPADATLDSLYTGRISREDFVRGRLPAQQARLEGVTATTERMADAITRRGAERVAGIQSAEQWAAILSAFLVGLALVAAFLVVRLGMAYRALAASEGVLRAESEAARAEAERRRAETERIAESRSRLIRGFTHDVKNPLGAAAGYLALVEEGALEAAEGHRRARRTLALALVLIDELLQLSGTESGDIVVRREPVDLLQVAREAMEDCRAQATAGGLLLGIEARDPLPPIASDAARVRQILGNLISNAVKYTPSGSVMVRVGLRDGVRDGQPHRWAAVEVTDTGPGLSAVELDQLFHEFRRLGNTIGAGGHGLGLAISKRLAEVLGGDVVVHSQPAVGSTFALLLPLIEVSPASPS